MFGLWNKTGQVNVWGKYYRGLNAKERKDVDALVASMDSKGLRRVNEAAEIIEYVQKRLEGWPADLGIAVGTSIVKAVCFSAATNKEEARSALKLASLTVSDVSEAVLNVYFDGDESGAK